MSEEWRSIPTCPRYEASNLGRIRVSATHRVIKPWTRRGYLKVTITVDGQRKQRFVHCLVAIAWLGRRPSRVHECCHVDGVKAHCQADNLVWGTRRRQVEDKRRHGTLPTRVPPRVVCDERGREMVGYLNAGHSRTQIGNLFGVHRSTVTKVVRRRALAPLLEVAA